VHPDHRRTGIGRTLLAWQIADARARFPDAPMVTLRQPGTAGVGALAVHAGFSAERVFLHLRRDLATPIEAAPLPAGLRAVEFTPAFDEAVRRSKNDAFSDHWNGLVDTPEQWRRRQLVPQLRRSWSRLALTEHGEVAAFVLAQRPDEGDDASLPLVGTDRAWRGRGAARALLTQALAACAAGGATGVALDVDGASPTGADRLYASLGFERVAAATVWALRPDTRESATMGG
jgi:ribosomal protein S18 acetylase RimI-like enzyme